MSTSLVPIEIHQLETVTGGKSNNGSGIDSLISQLNSITGEIKNIKTKTSGFGQTEMLMLCMLAMNRPPSANVVYVGGGPRRWLW